jgi:hypothetical protein
VAIAREEAGPAVAAGVDPAAPEADRVEPVTPALE